MSLVEAAAALDKLLRCPSHRAPHPTPPYPSYALAFQHRECLQGPTCSTPLEAPQVSALLPWNTLGYPVPDVALPVSPLHLPSSPLDQSFGLSTPSLFSPPAYPSPPRSIFPRPPQPPHLPQPSERWLALSRRPRVTKQDLQRAEDQKRKGRGPRVLGKEDFVPLDPEKYKTELCRSYQLYGVCRYGASRCNYAHGLLQLRGASRHGKYKTRNCQSYHHTGACRYGARCSFIHDPEEGVLKCSIANKEVLEALHYRPSSEEAGRTASITWRLLEAASDPVPELHLITTSRPLEEELSFLLSPRPSPSDQRCPGSERSVREEQDVFGYSFPLEDDVRTDLFKDNLGLISAPWLCEVDYCDFREATSKSSPDVKQGLPLRDSVLPLGQTSSSGPAGTLRRDSLGKRTRDIGREDLKHLDVVQDILQNAPVYSATVWSDGMSEMKEDRSSCPPTSSGVSGEEKPSSREVPQTEEIVAPPCIKWARQRSNSCLCRKRDAPRSKRRRRKERTSSAGNEELSWLSVLPAQTYDDDIVFSSTLRSDSEEEDGRVEGKGKINACRGEDRWSDCGMHLADLLRSLRIQECHHQVPWSRPSCRHSSDSSVASHLSSPTSPTPCSTPRSHDLTKYKTELCRSFQYNGFCGYGESCLYAHGPHDLRTYPKHPMYRTKQCFSFHQKGYCLYGSRCQFLHDLE